MRCSRVIRRDHVPDKWCFSGSGFPIPLKGFSPMDCISWEMRDWMDKLFDSFQYFKSAFALSV